MGRRLLTEGDLLTGPPVPLDESDIARLQALGPRAPLPTEGIQNIRERHHNFARLMAIGQTDQEIARIMGVTAAYLSKLRNSQLFLEILAEYREKVTRRLMSAHLVQRVQMTANDTLDEIQCRLADPQSRAAIPFKDLTAAAQAFLDRGGAGPHSTTHVERTGGLSKEELEEAKAAAARDISADSRIEIVRDRLEVSLAEGVLSRGEGEGAGV